MADIQKTLAQIIGVVLTLIGIIGFVMPSADGKQAMLSFGINALHNVVHLLTGVIGLWMGFSKDAKMSVAYNKWTGIVYIVLAVLGFLIPGFMLSLLNINMPDNIFHLVLGVVLSGIGFGVKN